MVWFGVSFAVLIGVVAWVGKHRAVKAIDLAGLSFLSPIVRLCYGEEPQKQLREIGRFIGVPLLAIGAFVVVWFAASERIQTKSGKLPNPVETWQSAKSILQIYYRELQKHEAYYLRGPEREAALASVAERLDSLGPEEEAAAASLAQAEQSAAERLASKLAPLQARTAERLEAVQADQAARTGELKRLATAAAAGGAPERDAYVQRLREHRVLQASEAESLRGFQASIAALQAASDPAVKRLRAQASALAEERQTLERVREQLTTANRATKIAAAEKSLETAKQALYAADPQKLDRAAAVVMQTEDRIESIETSGYAMPATLPYQVARSVLCVFFGFFLGTAIAVPLGVLCGLSKTCMAALTPFIAVFKPVSPIVWLPVALIVVGGFIPDPDKHWLTQWLWGLPWLGDYKINPAFIASAVTVALCSLWATMVNTAFGVASVDKDHINVARVLRLGFWSRLFKIVLPSSLPLVFAGLRISLGVGWMVLIAAELLSSSEGIGKFVWDQFNNGASDSFAKMVVVVFIVGAIGLVLDRTMIVFQKLVSFDGGVAAV